MDACYLKHLRNEIALIQNQGLFKKEREITSSQYPNILLEEGKSALNFCSNNYLGLSNHPTLIAKSIEALTSDGLGLASVRFICGTLSQHRTLEKKISSFLQTEDTILYSSCFDANGGLFETLFSSNDAIISDELNHASIIDGIRLSKANRFRYKNNDLADLRAKLQEAKNAQFKIIATDGIFSMDGKIADLQGICALADEYQALVMVDDCHGVGVMGEEGRGTIEHCNVLGRVDIITGTFGKALGGASGGYTSGRKEIIEILRQRSRPYLFSNTLSPSITAASIQALEIVLSSSSLRKKLHANTLYFRTEIAKLGFKLIPGIHPIIPILLGDAHLAQNLANVLLELGIYVMGFFYPVVPSGKARIRIQISAAHSKENLDFCLNALEKAGKELGVIP